MLSGEILVTLDLTRAKVHLDQIFMKCVFSFFLWLVSLALLLGISPKFFFDFLFYKSWWRLRLVTPLFTDDSGKQSCLERVQDPEKSEQLCKYSRKFC